jgi:hypothetical protein
MRAADCPESDSKTTIARPQVRDRSSLDVERTWTARR